MNEGVCQEASATHWASQREKGLGHKQDVMFGESKEGLSGDPEKQGTGLANSSCSGGCAVGKGREAP